MQELDALQEISVPSARPIPDASAADMVYARFDAAPDSVAVRRKQDGEWVDVSAAALRDEIEGVARGLIAAGITAGDRVAVMSKTRYEWAVLDIAVWAVGAVGVPIYETSSSDQALWILSDSGARAVVVESAEHEALVTALRDQLPELAHVWQIEAGGLATITEAGAAVDSGETAKRRAAVRSVDLATIIYTSGTTGRPKGVELTHGNFNAEVGTVVRDFDTLFSPDNATLLFLPAAHVFGRLIQVGTLASGCVLGHTADIKNLVAELGVFKPTFLLSAPRVFEKVYNGAKQRANNEGKGKIFEKAEHIAIAYSQALDTGRVPLKLKLAHAVFDKLVYSKLRAVLGGRCTTAISGSAPLGVRLGHFFRGIGLVVLEGYGLTETTAALTVNMPATSRIGTVGRPIPGHAIRLAADGEILARGPVVFTRYWKNEKATSESIDADGWFHTGDLGSLDADGFLSITGRKKELIVTAGGKNVAPAVLEDRVRANWLVSQCMVVGDGEPFIAALITIDPDSFPMWRERAGKPADATVADLVDDADLHAEIQLAIDDANKAVSRAESIRKFVVLPEDWTEAGGQLTPSLKLKRQVVMKECADEIAALYSGVSTSGE
jgi:long-chain acyl-CoA synthetase